VSKQPTAASQGILGPLAHRHDDGGNGDQASVYSRQPRTTSNSYTPSETSESTITAIAAKNGNAAISSSPAGPAPISPEEP
jgi:hypothetical protein